MDKHTDIVLKGATHELSFHPTLTNFLLASVGAGHCKIADFDDPSKADFAFISFAWAMLPREARANYKTPEDLAPDIDAKDGARVITAIINAINKYADSVKVVDDKGDRGAKKSTKKPSRSSR